MDRNKLANVDFNVYVGEGQERLVGIGQFDLPTIKFLLTELDAAGTGGKLNIPLTGITEAMQAKASGEILGKAAFRAAIPGGHMITARAAVRSLDKTSGKQSTDRVAIVMRGAASEIESGKLKRGEGTDASITFEVDYYKYIENGDTLIEIDKMNSICVIDGTDYLADVRDAI